MKKTTNIVIALSVVVFIATQFTNPLMMGFVYTKHISLFLVIGIVVFKITNNITDSTIISYELGGFKETLAHILKIVVFTSVLIITSVLQLGYIEYSDTPFTKGCVYYDNYGNTIYVSEYVGECPTMNILEHSDSVLEFEVKEERVSILSRVKFDNEDDTLYNDVEIKDYLLSTTRIEYDSKNRISVVYLNESYINDLVAESKRKIRYYSRSVITTNSYINGFRQIIRIASINEDIDESNADDISHNIFANDDYNIISYFTEENSVNEITLLKNEVLDGVDTKNEILTYSTSVSGEDETMIISDSVGGSIKIERESHVVFNDEEVVVDVLQGGEDSYSTNKTSYVSNEDYKYLVVQRDSYIDDYDNETWNTITSWSLSKIEGRDYITRKLTTTRKPSFDIKDKIYLLKKTDYGFIVEYLNFEEDSFLAYLINKNEDNSRGIFMNNIMYSSTSIFDVSNYSEFQVMDDLIYNKPVFLLTD